jgi:flavodoxin
LWVAANGASVQLRKAVEHSVLVAHASRQGPARRVGEAIAVALASRGLDVDVCSAATVESLDPYGAVVVGGPVRRGRWHRDIRRFLDRHRRVLARIPVAVFASESPAAAAGAEDVAEALADTPELEPIATGRFVGPPLGVRARMFGRRRAVDDDPGRIRRWADEVARELGA